MIDLIVRAFRKARYLRSMRKVPAGVKRVAQVHVNDSELLVFCNEDVGRQIYFTRRYEIRETRWIKSVARPDWVLFDIGANTGYYSMLFATLAKRGAVHSFEPSELNWHMLTLTAAVNGFKNIHITKAAVSDTRGVASFDRANDGAYSSMKHTGRKPSDLIESVATIRLDEYVADQGIGRVDFIKIDVEGAEGLVLGGISGLLSSETLVPKWIMVELVDDNLRSFSTSALEIAALLRKAGYQSFTIDANGELVAADIVDTKKTYNFIFRHCSAVQ
jgi:FkbM family methyltransferase